VGGLARAIPEASSGISQIVLFFVLFGERVNRPPKTPEILVFDAIR
jgi:hypothetical protein